MPAVSDPIVVDCGGSGVRLGIVHRGGVGDVTNISVESLPDLVRSIRRASPAPSCVAVSIAGFVDSQRGIVRLSRCASWAEGHLAHRLTKELGCPAIVLNDGEAHALAMLTTPEIRFGAIAVSLGTSVGVGIVGADRKLLKPCSGENWDFGEWKLHTSAANPDLWWALGAKGLHDLEADHGPEQGARQFGFRLGAFLAQLTCIFQPKTIVLSGGIPNTRWNDMKGPTRQELEQIPEHFEHPQLVRSPFPQAGLVGAASLVTQRLAL